MYVLSQGSLLAEAILEIAAGGVFVAPKMALFTNNGFPSKTSILTDFVIDNFGGLTNLKSIIWGAPWINDNGQAEVLGALLSWLTVTAPDPAVTAYGYVMTNTAGDTLLLAERFALPLVFGRAGQSEGVLPRLVFDT